MLELEILNVGGNTVLITGGATGIGFALAERFAEAESEVVVCGRRNSKLQNANVSYRPFMSGSVMFP